MKRKRRHAKLTLALILGGLTQASAHGADLVPLPEEIFDNKNDVNPVLDITNRTVSGLGRKAPEIPDTLQVTNEGGTITFDNEKNVFLYQSGENSMLRLRTDSGSDIHTPAMEARLDTSEAILSGPMTVYQDDVLVRGEDGGFYNWKTKQTSVSKVRIKVNGLLVRGSRIEYNTDEQGKEYITVYDAYVTTEDIQNPTTWVGTGTLTIYPGDYGEVSRLSIATGDTEITVPVLGWFTFSHSLNPREGYLPGMGTRSHWGAYLENNYGILFGNRRVEGIMPTADYLATLHLDARTRRGLATGLDLEDIAMSKKHEDMEGFFSYFADDLNPNINPVDTERKPIDDKRYFLSLKALWDVTPDGDSHADWQLVSNVNVASDQYMLRDFLPDISRVNDKPDNTIRLVRRTDETQSMIYTRFAPNDYYMTDERLEASFYRVRTAIGKTGINYETNNTASIMRQYLPTEERELYKTKLAKIKDKELRDYYERLLNTESYFRVNSTHEFTTNLTAYKFLNITPKAGGGYTGYYDVGGIGSDNRFLGYVGCDFNLKFHNTYPNFQFKNYGLQGLTHIIQPYASYSSGSSTSSNKNVPQVDVWSSTKSGSTTNPMPLDLLGYAGIDGWGDWNVWRFGIKNTLLSSVDGEKIKLLTWDAFCDYNADNPNSDYDFSSLYNIIRFSPSKRFELSLSTQTPTINKGEGFWQYSIGARVVPAEWLETYVSYRGITDHPVQEDTGQYHIRTNIRLSEKYTFSIKLYYEDLEGRFPIQQYSLFRHTGAWYIGTTVFLRDNGGKKEQGLGISFTLGETGTTLPIDLL
ncbi:MAG: hypothetical protein J6R92_03400 [Akkermansia sp.]|nr:hypothetical protein [Akkermansia sp.]